MPVFTLQVRAENRVAIVSWARGEPVLETWREALRAVLQDPQFLPDYGIVSDRRLVDAPLTAFVDHLLDDLVTAQEMGRFTGRWASVVAADDLAAFGMARMAEILAELRHVQYRLFTNVSEAVEWASRSSDEN